MSFDSRLFSMEDFLPEKPRNRNGKNGKRSFANGRTSAKEAVMGFESPEFFMGLAPPRQGNGVPKADVDLNLGLDIPELGQGFNSRIGNIGTGFTEAVDPYRVGFRDILTGNGRTGEIITGAPFGKIDVSPPGIKRKRGRPRKLKPIQRKNLEFETKEVKERRKAGEDVKTESRTVGSLLKERIKEKVKPSGFKSTNVSLGRGTGQVVEEQTTGFPRGIV